MVQIEFINLLINRRSLDRVYPGGSEKFIRDWGPFNGRSSSYDDDLVKFGAMNPADIDELIQELQEIGLVGLADKDRQKVWVDFCVLDELMGLGARCDWVTYNYSERTASFVDGV